ncbi:MAG: (deoxy)nucleoside triphosphate pyrophosphohydrolase [Bacteroidales bacterium]|nr:(deoxy)nucleoside triphosphate pyrophosphohydrolase [Bacteroidales bacterium]
MKTIEVVAALIVHEGRIFATQRGYGDWKGYWEFPGGKIEPGETPEEALVREIREELATEIRVERYVTTIEWDYPAFHLSMRCYLCSIVSGNLTLLEHEAATWLDRQNLRSVQWLPADETILDEIDNRILI